MEEEAEQLHFEAAAKTRDQIEHIEKVIEKQKMVSRDFVDQDVIGFHRLDPADIVYLLFVRQEGFWGKGLSIFLHRAPCGGDSFLLSLAVLS